MIKKSVVFSFDRNENDSSDIDSMDMQLFDNLVMRICQRVKSIDNYWQSHGIFSAIAVKTTPPPKASSDGIRFSG